MPEPIEFPVDTRRKVGRDGLGYIWQLDDPPVEFHVDYLDGRGQMLNGEVSVKWKDSPLAMATMNLSSIRERQELVRYLDEQTPVAEVPWGRLLNRFCVAVLIREREGSPTQYPEETDAREPITYMVDKLAIKGKTNSLFAPGGSGKGFLSVAVCCAVAAKCGLADMTTLPAHPGYLDWEDDFRTFNDRLNSVARGMNVALPRIPYRRMRGLLSNNINKVAQFVDEEGIDFLVVDSFSVAGGTVTANTSWDAIAHRFFDATDLLPNVTWFIVDHVTGDAASNKKLIAKAFGSIQKANRVRNAWGMLNVQEPGSSISHMLFYDGKWNHTGHRAAFGLRMEFSEKDVKFFSETPVEMDEYEERPSRGNSKKVSPISRGDQYNDPYDATGTELPWPR
jgi:hypothetical protein